MVFTVIARWILQCLDFILSCILLDVFIFLFSLNDFLPTFCNAGLGVMNFFSLFSSWKHFCFSIQFWQIFLLDLFPVCLGSHSLPTGNTPFFAAVPLKFLCVNQSLILLYNLAFSLVAFTTSLQSVYLVIYL